MSLDQVENTKKYADQHKSDIFLFENIFKQYYEPLIKFAYRYVNVPAVAENIVHDIFLYLWNERKRIDFTINIKTYLYNAVKNRCLNHLSKMKLRNDYKISEFEVSVNSQTPESILINKELEEALKNAINEIPAKRREIYVMNRFDQLTYAEMAFILKISVKTVETQMSRSIKFLRKKLAAFLISVL